jgi:hypothetical protein
MESPFTSHDCQLQRRVYKAFENNADDDTIASNIASIRDEAIARHDNASTFVLAFSTILQSRKIPRNGPQWLCFNECLKDQNIAKEKEKEEERKWKLRLEHLAFISMQWSPDVVSDYNWTAEKMFRDELAALYGCAVRYPSFKKDFLPQINLVWWLRYTADIPNIHYSMSKSERFFRNVDLQCLLDLHKSGTTTIHGLEIKPDSADHLGKYIRTWTESKDGRVRMPERTIDLQALKSKHWNMYALCTDKYGLLKQRDRSGWTDVKLPAAVAQELHSYPFADQSIEPGIVPNDRTDVGETATEGLRESSGLAPKPDFCTSTAGAVSNSATSSEPTMVFSDSVNCSLSDMNPRKTSKLSRSRMASLKGGTRHTSHYNLRPEDCLCSVCQDLRPFLNKMRSDYLRSGPAHLRQLRKKWLTQARWASRGDIWSSSKDRFSDIDIWSLNESSLEELANDSCVLDKPVVVTEAALDCVTHSMDSVQAVIRDNYCENEVERFLSLISNNEQSTASCFLRGPFQVHDPKFMGFGRFTVLQRASTRAFNSLLASSGENDHCCKDPLHNSILASGSSYVRIETTGAASGPHISPLGGSWFRSLVGKRLYVLAKTSGLQPMQDNQSSTSGQDWILSPIGKVQLILLEPNDVLILPPGMAFLHFAVDPSATLEGHFWDDKDIDRYLEATEMARQHPSLAAVIPPCVPRRAIDGYESISRGRKPKGVCRQRPIEQAGVQLLNRWRSCLPSEESRVEDAASGVSLASGSSYPNFAVGTESDTRQETGEHGADRAKRVCIR